MSSPSRKRALLLAFIGACHAIAAITVYARGRTLVAGLLLFGAVVIAVMSYVNWRRGRVP